jgi:hypothetical protein
MDVPWVKARAQSAGSWVCIANCNNNDSNLFCSCSSKTNYLYLLDYLEYYIYFSQRFILSLFKTNSSLALLSSSRQC